MRKATLIRRVRELLRVAQGIKDFGVTWDKCIANGMMDDPYFNRIGFHRYPNGCSPVCEGFMNFSAIRVVFGFPPDDLEGAKLIYSIFGGASGGLRKRVNRIKKWLCKLETGSEVAWKSY